MGYFASNRPGGKGQDDLYRVNRLTVQAEVIVVDAATGQPLTGAVVTGYDDQSGEMLKSDPQANCTLFQLKPGSKLIALAQKDGYADTMLLVPMAAHQPGQLVPVRIEFAEAEEQPQSNRVRSGRG